MVGNGEIAFTADITGLQTFPEQYSPLAPLLIESQWGWHSFPNTGGFAIEQAEVPVALRGVKGKYPWIRDWEEAKQPHIKWLRENPHKFSLGRLGLWLMNSQGKPATFADLSDTKQTLDLWSGRLTSSFRFDGAPVEVETSVHPTRDILIVRLKSPLLFEGQIKAVIELASLRHFSPTNVIFLEQLTQSIGVVLNTTFLVREIRRNEQHDAFINAVTHELKTPVASIRLYLETLQTRNVDDAKRQEFYRIMLDGVEAIRVPAQSAVARWGYYKACRKTGEYAHAIGAVLFDRSRDVFRAVIGATERKPLVLADARPWFSGKFDLSAFDRGAADAALQAAGMADPPTRQWQVCGGHRTAMPGVRRQADHRIDISLPVVAVRASAPDDRWGSCALCSRSARPPPPGRCIQEDDGPATPRQPGGKNRGSQHEKSIQTWELTP